VKEIQGPYIAWYQGPFERIVVEVTSAPKWAVPLPYEKNWKRPMWEVEINDPTPRMTACSGQPQIETRHLHPMNADTRALLALREGRPPSPFVKPKVPPIVFPSAEEVAVHEAFAELERLEKLRAGIERLNVGVERPVGPGVVRKEGAP
jgi:hypothetical protein